MNIKNIENLILEECKKILSENPNDKQFQNSYYVLLEEMREHDCIDFNSCSTFPISKGLLINIQK